MITMPRIRRPSHCLTWRPGVNQRTTRGFIRIGATGAPSLAQHFLNSISADFVTSVGPYPGRWKRAYNPLRFREPYSDRVQPSLFEGNKGGRLPMPIKAEGVTLPPEPRPHPPAHYWHYL